MSEPTSNPDLSAVEHALAGLSPSAGRLNRDALLFAAGRRSVRRGWGWPTAALASTLAAATLAGILVLRPEPVRVEYVTILEPAPPANEIPVSPAEQRSAPIDEAVPTFASPDRPDRGDRTLLYQVAHWSDASPPQVAPAANDSPARIDDSLDLPPDFRTDPWLQRSKAMLTPGGAL